MTGDGGNPYDYVTVRADGGKGRGVPVHRLVALGWIPNPDPTKYKVVDHISDDKGKTNEISNLRWSTHSANHRKPAARAKAIASQARANANPITRLHKSEGQRRRWAKIRGEVA